MVRSATKNAPLRATLRKTWLSVSAMGLRPAGLADYRFFVDTGCCPEEQKEFGDLEEMNGTRFHPRFFKDYPSANHTNMFKAMMYYDPKDTELARKFGNFSRDYEVNMLMRSLRLFNFHYLLAIDDDSLLCTPNLVHQLRIQPEPLSSFILGYARGGSFDNSFVLMSRNIIDFFDLHYYDALRDTNRGQATFGATWGGRAADWDQVMAKHGLHVVKRSGNPSYCAKCMEEEEKKPNCSKYLDNECSLKKLRLKGIFVRYSCLSQRCLPDHHPCNNFHLIDHQPNDGFWPGKLNEINRWYKDPTRICVDKINFDKMKNTSAIMSWWRLVTSKEHSFRDLSAYFAAPSKLPEFKCLRDKNRLGPDTRPNEWSRHSSRRRRRKRAR